MLPEGLTPGEKSKRCALLGAQPNGRKGPAGYQGGGCACFCRGSGLEQPMRRTTEVASLTDESLVGYMLHNSMRRYI